MQIALRKELGRVAVIAGVIALAGVLFAFCVAYFGLYNVAATAPHSALTHRFVHFVATRSITVRAKDLTPPALASSDLRRGLTIFDHVCAQCHGAPGKAPDAFAEGMNPNPPALAQVGKEWSLQQIYWTTLHGVKMTGMPAFEFRMPDKDIWSTAAFVKRLPDLTVADYRRRLADLPNDHPAEPMSLAPQPQSAKRGRIALLQHACVTCHYIPGLAASLGARTGPSLAGLGGRTVIAGSLANTNANLAAFIQHPEKFRPDGAMPDMRVGVRDASDMIVYLRGLTAK